eukprot:g4956.t1
MTENPLDTISEVSSASSTQSKKSLHVTEKLFGTRVSKFLNKRRRAVSLTCLEIDVGIEFSEKSEFAIPIEQKKDPLEYDHPVTNVSLEETETN